MSNDKEWSEGVGELAADALIDAGLISKEEFKKTGEIIAEEVFVRLCLNDRPNGSGEE